MEDQDRNALQELLDEIQGAVKDVVSLKITTMVGDVQKADLASDPTFTNTKTMYTQIDLMQGDIVSVIDQAFLSEELAGIRQHHEGREDQAHEIINKNIAALERLVKLVQDLLESGEE